MVASNNGNCFVIVKCYCIVRVSLYTEYIVLYSLWLLCIAASTDRVFFISSCIQCIHIQIHTALTLLYIYQSSNQCVCVCVCMMWLNRAIVYKRISLNVIISSFLFISQSHTPLWFVHLFVHIRGPVYLFSIVCCYLLFLIWLLIIVQLLLWKLKHNGHRCQKCGFVWFIYKYIKRKSYR